MSKSRINTVACLLALVSVGGISQTERNTTPVEYVHPLIGTAPSTTQSALKNGRGSENNAQVIPSVTMPLGMTNWTPQTRSTEKKCIAPYYYKDERINGFRASHWLSGSCTQDYGSITLMPLQGIDKLLPEERGSRYSHSDEIATPYYYNVLLSDDSIHGEMTATTRTGIVRFTFSRGDSGWIVVEPNNEYGEGSVRIIPEKNEIECCNPVHRIYQGWGENAGFSGYYVLRFERPFHAYGIYQNHEIRYGEKEISNKEKIGGFVSFVLGSEKSLVVKVGTSFTSIEEARNNLDTELAGHTFETIKEKLKEVWSSVLSHIDITASSEEEKIIFYTALYHCFQQPRIYNDCNGSYPSFAGADSVCNSGTKNYYDDFSLWDTYRALHPLFIIIAPQCDADMMWSLLVKGRQGGWLPIFPCWNSYTSAMIGDHAIAAVADASIKGIINLREDDYTLLKKNATKTPDTYGEYTNGKGRRALQSYLKYGYIPLDDDVNESFHKGEQVSRTLEYAYDDFALSQIAAKMGKKDDAGYFLARSNYYKNVFDTSVSCVRGKYVDRSFTDNFDKTERMPYITEGTPWQYTWYVPQDIPGLIMLMGGKEKFNKNLDDFFAAGQYWHGNEPGHQIPFLYTYSGEPEKTQQRVAKIMKEEYSADPGGLSGNDDSGQMSAWYIFAAMGFYPVCPGKDEYAVFAPSFEHIRIHCTDGNLLTITAPGIASGKTHVKEIKMNGIALKTNTIPHALMKSGGTLEFVME